MTKSRSQLASSSPENRIDFGQEDLAEFIIDEISDDPDIHIAINGPWGSGKTTVLKKAYKNITKKESSISVWYEPWRYSPDQTTLRRTVLKTAYDSASKELDSVEPLEDEIFHSDQIESKPRTSREFLNHFFNTIKNELRFLFVIVVCIAVPLILSLGSNILIDGLTGRILSQVFTLLAFIFIGGLGLYIRSDLMSKLSQKLMFENKNQKLVKLTYLKINIRI